MTGREQPGNHPWRTRRHTRARLVEVASQPWAIYLNGKLNSRAVTHAETLRISGELAKRFPNATITQRYEVK